MRKQNVVALEKLAQLTPEEKNNQRRS